MLLANINPDTQEVEDTSLLPTCPHCLGEMTLNVRSGYWFVEDPYQHQEKLFNKWLQKSSAKNLLVLELGVGFNTPSVIRWPVEKIITDTIDARLIRVNMDYPDVPEDIKEKSISVKARIASFVEVVSKQLKEKRKCRPLAL